MSARAVVSYSLVDGSSDQLLASDILQRLVPYKQDEAARTTQSAGK